MACALFSPDIILDVSLLFFVIFLFNFVLLFIASFKSNREKKIVFKIYNFNYSLFASLWASK